MPASTIDFQWREDVKRTHIESGKDIGNLNLNLIDAVLNDLSTRAETDLRDHLADLTCLVLLNLPKHIIGDLRKIQVLSWLDDMDTDDVGEHLANLRGAIIELTSGFDPEFTAKQEFTAKPAVNPKPAGKSGGKIKKREKILPANQASARRIGSGHKQAREAAKAKGMVIILFEANPLGVARYKPKDSNDLAVRLDSKRQGRFVVVGVGGVEHELGLPGEVIHGRLVPDWFGVSAQGFIWQARGEPYKPAEKDCLDCAALICWQLGDFPSIRFKGKGNKRTIEATSYRKQHAVGRNIVASNGLLCGQAANQTSYRARAARYAEDPIAFVKEVCKDTIGNDIAKYYKQNQDATPTGLTYRHYVCFSGAIIIATSNGETLPGDRVFTALSMEDDAVIEAISTGQNGSGLQCPCCGVNLICSGQPGPNVISLDRIHSNIAPESADQRWTAVDRFCQGFKMDVPVYDAHISISYQRFRDNQHFVPLLEQVYQQSTLTAAISKSKEVGLYISTLSSDDSRAIDDWYRKHAGPQVQGKERRPSELNRNQIVEYYKAVGGRCFVDGARFDRNASPGSTFKLFAGAQDRIDDAVAKYNFSDTTWISQTYNLALGPMYTGRFAAADVAGAFMQELGYQSISSRTFKYGWIRKRLYDLYQHQGHDVSMLLTRI